MGELRRICRGIVPTIVDLGFQERLADLLLPPPLHQPQVVRPSKPQTQLEDGSSPSEDSTHVGEVDLMLDLDPQPDRIPPPPGPLRFLSATRKVLKTTDHSLLER